MGTEETDDCDSCSNHQHRRPLRSLFFGVGFRAARFLVVYIVVCFSWWMTCTPSQLGSTLPFVRFHSVLELPRFDPVSLPNGSGGSSDTPSVSPSIGWGLGETTISEDSIDVDERKPTPVSPAPTWILHPCLPRTTMSVLAPETSKLMRRKDPRGTVPRGDPFLCASRANISYGNPRSGIPDAESSTPSVFLAPVPPSFLLDPLPESTLTEVLCGYSLPSVPLS